VLDHLFCKGLLRPGFLSHLRSLKSYNEPEILPSSTPQICPIGADAGQSAQSVAAATTAEEAVAPLSGRPSPRHHPEQDCSEERSAEEGKAQGDITCLQAPFAHSGSSQEYDHERKDGSGRQHGTGESPEHTA
ncbi:MAG TPA: hypothetical protein VGN97_22680, partial [Mesorhizobium sp.]|nr:hypothetical protein [Mesorhizobium sp.]